MQNIEIYYQSIKLVYDEIVGWEKRPKPFRQKFANSLIGVAATMFGLSLIPIIPSIFVFVGSQLRWHVADFDLSQSTIGTYALAWLIGTISTLFLFLGMMAR